MSKTISKMSHGVDICYIVSHGFALRMILQTGLIQKLTQRGYTIAIVAPDVNDQNFDSLRESKGVSLHQADIKQTIWDDDYHVKRRYFLEDIKANPVLWEKHIHSILYSNSKHPWKRIRPFIYYPIYKLIPTFPSIRRKFLSREDQYLDSNAANQLLHKINPKLVVATYPVNYLEAKFLHAGKKQGRSTLIHLLSWDNITSKGIFPVIPDRFIAWGSIMRDELKEYYALSKDKIHVCGVPHFDQHVLIRNAPQELDFLKQLSLDSSRPYLFIAMSAPRFAPYEIDIVEWLAKAIRNDVFGKDYQLVIRPHPQNVQGVFGNKSWLKRLKQLEGDRVGVDYPKMVESGNRWSMLHEDMIQFSYLLKGSSICLNSGSTVSIDALMLDRPVILTSFDGDKRLSFWKSARRLTTYTHLKKFIALGGAEVAHDYPSLTKLIKKYIQYPSANLTQRRSALEQECFKPDGWATDRTVHTMAEIMNQISKAYAE